MKRESKKLSRRHEVNSDGIEALIEDASGMEIHIKNVTTSRVVKSSKEWNDLRAKLHKRDTLESNDNTEPKDDKIHIIPRQRTN